MKRIDKSGIIAVVVLNDEMAWQADAKHGHRQAAGNLHVHYRKRDRDACAPLQHLVQATVQRVEIIRLVAVEPEFLEQIPLCRLDEIPSVVEIAHAVRQPRCQFVQLVQNRLHCQVRKMDGGYFERRQIQPTRCRVVF